MECVDYIEHDMINVLMMLKVVSAVKNSLRAFFIAVLALMSTLLSIIRTFLIMISTS